MYASSGSGATVVPMPSSGPAHHAVIAHRGSFAHARCETCGWTGAARRSLGRARLDAEAHLLLGPSADGSSSEAFIDLREMADAPTDR